MTELGRRTASYLRLTNDDWLLSAIEGVPSFAALSAFTVLDLQRPETVNQALLSAFAVSSVPGDDSVLSSALPIESVTWPPLLVLSQDRVTLPQMEIAAVVDALARSQDWFGASIGRAPAADLLQILAEDQRSGLICVTCPHMPALSSRRWEAGAPACTQDPQTCRGWAVRLYLDRGRLVYAEGPANTGIEALSQVLQLQEGFLRAHEVYLLPAERNLDGTVQQLIIEAAVLADERAHSAPTSRRDSRPVDLARTRVSTPAAHPRPRRPRRPVQELEIVDEPTIAKGPPAMPRSRVRPRPSTSPSVESLLDAAEDLQTAVETDGEGTVLRSVGDGDPESTAAVAKLCRRSFEALGGQLQLGDLEHWCVVGESTALYVQHRPARTRMTLGSASPHAFRILRKLFEPNAT